MVAPALVPAPLLISKLLPHTANRQRADERTRTADLLTTSDHSGVAGCARDCKCRIFRACANRLWFAGGSVLPAVANPALPDEPPDHYDHVGEGDPEVYDPTLPLGTPEQ